MFGLDEGAFLLVSVAKAASGLFICGGIFRNSKGADVPAGGRLCLITLPHTCQKQPTSALRAISALSGQTDSCYLEHVLCQTSIKDLFSSARSRQGAQNGELPVMQLGFSPVSPGEGSRRFSQPQDPMGTFRGRVATVTWVTRFLPTTWSPTGQQ